MDDWIPFVKAFIIPYLLWFPYLYGALIYYCFADRKQYYVTLSSVIFGKLACFSIYYFWQTTVPRPTVVGTDVFSELVRYIYSIDQPVNCFPSIHVLTTFVIMLVPLSVENSMFLNITSLLSSVHLLFYQRYLRSGMPL